MDALVMEKFLHLLRDLHVVGQIAATYMSRGNNTIAGQLPHVKLVNGQYSVDVFQESLLYRVNLYVSWYRLQ